MTSGLCFEQLKREKKKKLKTNLFKIRIRKKELRSSEHLKINVMGQILTRTHLLLLYENHSKGFQL